MKHRIIVTLLCLLPFFTANAQRARLYTSELGLPNSQVNSIFQDAQGFVWICTENGLARFDGRDFVTFRHVRDKEDALASDLVLTVFQDTRNTFWVGTSTGLQTFDSSLRSFTRVDLGDPLYPGSTQHIAAIKEIRTGIGESEIWVGSSQHGVYILDAESHVTRDDRRSKLSPSLASAIVYRMFQDSRGWVWIAGETGGLTVVNASSLERQDVTFPSSIAVKDFEEDPASGNILLATMAGLYIYDASKGVIRQSSDPGARACQAFSLLYDRNLNRAGTRSFWVGTELGGLKVYDMAADRISSADLPSVGRDISRWKVHSLVQDNQGNIWVGAYQTGVMVIPSSMYGFEYTRIDYGCVSSLAKAPGDGSLCVGTDGGGIHMIAADGSRTIIDASSSGLMVDSVTDMVFDRSGKLWIATYLGGLFTYTPSRGLRPFAGSGEIGTDNLACLAYDPLGDLLYVGTYGAGMSIVDATREAVTEKVAEDINMWVSALYIDRMGTVWIGTFNGPMFYNHVVGRLYPYDVGNALGKARVYCFHEGSDGVLWIGTGEGLAACDRNGASVRYYTEADGLSSNVISAILEAGDGTLWISTSFGLNRMNQQTRAFTSYYSYDGLQGNEFHHGAAFQDADGKLYFGGTDGVTSFFPQVVLQKVHSIPPLYFTRLTVLNQEVDFDSESRLTLPGDSNTFSMEFSVLEYTNPMKIRYKYRLEGFDQGWRSLPASSHEVSYSNLPPGRYTLNVRAYFDGTPQNYSSASIKLRVMPPWYLSPGAFVIYLALFAAMIWVFGYFLRRRREHKKEREASEIKELKLKMFTNISHEIRTPLTLLMSPLKQMREAEKDPRQKDRYNLMYRNSLRILRLVNQIMDMRKVDEGKMLLYFRETDIVYFVRDIMQSFDDMANSRSINLSITPASDVINLWIDQGNFDKIVFNLLSNAFKHTPDGGRISIGISAPERNRGALAPEILQQVRITITNSGSHIEETNLDRVFERFFQNDVLDAKMGSGVGLSLTRMLVELHHGTITAGNTQDGVCFTVTMPVGCEHLSEQEMSHTSHHKDLYTKMPSTEEMVRTTEDIAFMPSAESSDKVVKSRRSVVIVDDDPEIRDYLLAELRTQYNVKTFAGAQDAWADISAAQPDVVVSDLVMSGMDGLELCRRIRHNPVTNHIPVIILTSSSDETSHLESIDSGADRFLSKPLSIDILRSSIAQVIQSRDTMRGKFSGGTKYDYDEVKVTPVGAGLMDRVMEIVKQNLDNPDFGVEDLSREVGMSRVHMNRKLKEALGISPSSLIKSTRMKQAAYLLVHDKVNISEVAYRVGFSTPSYFSNSFRSYFGLSPKEFVAKYSDVTDREVLDKLFE